MVVVPRRWLTFRGGFLSWMIFSPEWCYDRGALVFCAIIVTCHKICCTSVVERRACVVRRLGTVVGTHQLVVVLR